MRAAKVRATDADLPFVWLATDDPANGPVLDNDKNAVNARIDDDRFDGLEVTGETNLALNPVGSDADPTSLGQECLLPCCRLNCASSVLQTPLRKATLDDSDSSRARRLFDGSVARWGKAGAWCQHDHELTSR
ncbi:MAG TPA: hypothetical protein VH986_10165 [Acidimicrobiia bacterium]